MNEDTAIVLSIVVGIAFVVGYVILKHFTDDKMERNKFIKITFTICAIIYLVLGVIVGGYDMFEFYSVEKKVMLFQSIFVGLCTLLFIIFRKRIINVDKKKKRALLVIILLINCISSILLMES